MKTLLSSLGLFLFLFNSNAQDICLERMPVSDTSGNMHLNGLYNAGFGPLADFNNDGYAEFPYYAEYASMWGSGYYLGVSQDDPSGIYLEDTSWTNPGSPHQFAAGDFNEDGNMDFITGGFIGAVEIYTGNGQMHFTPATLNYSGGYVTGIGAADFDGDGHLDAVFSGQQMNATFTFLHGNGNGSFAAPVLVNNLPGLYPVLKIADYNNDGTKDVAVSGCGIFFNDGTGNFNFVQMAFPAGWFDVADFNNDGNADLIGTDTIYYGSGFGNFPQHLSYTLPAGMSPYRFTIDLNGDGRNDLPVKQGGNANDTLLIFLNNGNGTFSQSNVLIPLDSMYAPVLGGDIDGNGTNDLVVMRTYVDFEAPRTDIYQLLNRTAQISANSVSLCANDSLLLSATAGNDQYSWSTGDTTAAVWVSTAGTYSVTTSIGTCSSSAVFTVNAISATDFAPLNSTGHFCYYASAIPLTTGSPAGGVYSGPGVSNGYFNPLAAGIGTHVLYYSVNNNSPCDGIDSLTVTVDLCMETGAGGQSALISVFPNPANDQLQLNFGNASVLELQFYDACGRLVFSEKFSGTNTAVIPVNEFAPGIYLLRANTESGISVSRIQISR